MHTYVRTCIHTIHPPWGPAARKSLQRSRDRWEQKGYGCGTLKTTWPTRSRRRPAPETQRRVSTPHSHLSSLTMRGGPYGWKLLRHLPFFCQSNAIPASHSPWRPSCLRSLITGRRRRIVWGSLSEGTCSMSEWQLIDLIAIAYATSYLEFCTPGHLFLYGSVPMTCELNRYFEL